MPVRSATRLRPVRGEGAERNPVAFGQGGGGRGVEA
jgi:hypothetical protein